MITTETSCLPPSTRPSRRWQAQVTTHTVLRREHALQLVREFVLRLPVRSSNPAPPLLHSVLGRSEDRAHDLSYVLPPAARASWTAAVTRAAVLRRRRKRRSSAWM